MAPRTGWRRILAGEWRWSALLLLAAASLTPSLMPRSALFQGLVTALVVWAGWLLLALVGATFGGVVRVNVSDSVRHWVGRLLLLGTGCLFVVLLWRWPQSQRPAHVLAGVDPPEPVARVVVLLVALGLTVVLLAASWAVVAAGRRLGRPLERVIAARWATVVGCLVVLLLLGGLADRWLVRSVFNAVDNSFDSLNNGTPPGATVPDSPLRSGAPASLSLWDELGEQGRAFVAFGPTVGDIRSATDGAARQPIRVYAGLDSSEEQAELAQLAVNELERTGAFDREVLCVAVPTGRGWINPSVIAALEYLYAGDSATVGMQYSYLPSPLAFLVDPERAKEAGETLFEAVYARWAELPPAERPRLVVYGESLGSTGAQAAFSGLPDLRERTDGALFVGPPESNVLWRDLVDRRDRGSREVLPVYDGGATARFASRPRDLGVPPPEWEYPRAIFLQNPSDPIVWWSPSMAWDRPDWLSEPRGHDVSASVRWYPLATFLQVTFDMAVANNVPVGHGHRYRDFVAYWAAIVPPDSWTETDTRRLSAGLGQCGSSPDSRC